MNKLETLFLDHCTRSLSDPVKQLIKPALEQSNSYADALRAMNRLFDQVVLMEKTLNWKIEHPEIVHRYSEKTAIVTLAVTKGWPKSVVPGELRRDARLSELTSYSALIRQPHQHVCDCLAVMSTPYQAFEYIRDLQESIDDCCLCWTIDEPPEAILAA